MDRIFLITVVISLFGHLLLFYPWPALKSHNLFKSSPEIEISYFKVKPNPPKEIKQAKVSAKKKRVTESITQQEAETEKKPQSAIKKIKPKAKQVEENLPVLSKEEEMVARDSQALSKNPVYLDYYRAIREKIKISANRHKPAHFGSGEVYVFFVLNSQGSLRRFKVIENKSSADPILREAALRSVEDASPFPTFPEGLNRNQIAFNIIIAFEIR